MSIRSGETGTYSRLKGPKEATSVSASEVRSIGIQKTQLFVQIADIQRIPLTDLVADGGWSHEDLAVLIDWRR